MEYLLKKLRYGVELLFVISGVFFLGFISVEYVFLFIFLIMGVDGFIMFVVEFDSFIGKMIIVVVLVLGVVILFSIYFFVEDVINGVLNDLKYVFFVLGVI